MQKKALLRLASILLSTTLLFTACASQTQEGISASTTPADNSSREAEATGQEKAITVMVAEKMNPEEASPVESSMSMFMYEMIYEPLIRYGHGGEILPGLAESWNVSEDGKVYTFHLRKDVKFSDGTEFNADSVLTNAARWNPETFSTPFLGAEKLDDYTVVLSFEENCYPILTELTYPRPYRMAADAAFNENGEFVKPVGSGPWMLDSYISEEEVVLVPNPSYYGDKPKLDKVVFRRVTDGQSRVMALQSGDADLSLEDLPAEGAAIIQQSEQLDFLNTVGTMGFYLICNENNPILQDENVRKALNYAVDKESIVANIFGGNAVAASGLFPETVPYVTAENSKGYSFDPDKAKEALAAAGYADTDGDGIVEKEGQALQLRLIFQAEEYASWKYLCEFLQAEMKKVGIDIQLDQRESAAYYDVIWRNRDFDLVIYRTYTDSWNPHGFLRSQFYRPEGSEAVSWYDAEINEYLKEVLLLQDEAQRQAKYDQIFTALNDKALCVPICYPNKQYAYNTRLKNLTAASTTYEAVDWLQIDVD